jgi:hypothetical protein
LASSFLSNSEATGVLESKLVIGLAGSFDLPWLGFLLLPFLMWQKVLCPKLIIGFAWFGLTELDSAWLGWHGLA